MPEAASTDVTLKYDVVGPRSGAPLLQHAAMHHRLNPRHRIDPA
jgi:hypothetical protein